MYQKTGKRFFDVIFSMIALFFLSGLLILIAILIKMDSKGPIIFRQTRVGKNKSSFYIYKFRTMIPETPPHIPTHLLMNPNAYITKVGQLLRKSSLDELPQLVNILKGDMSLVGPRPALWNQVDLIQARDRLKVNQLFPGITGWAQVNGRGKLSDPDKAHFDGEYAKCFSFTFDMRCLLRTIICILKGEGIFEGITK